MAEPLKRDPSAPKLCARPKKWANWGLGFEKTTSLTTIPSVDLNRMPHSLDLEQMNK